MDALFASYVTPTPYPIPKLILASPIRYLGDHVKSGYKFLMQNYRPGDKVCLFGA